MFSRYFQSELTYLRQLGQEFAEENPSLAGVFADRGGDPDVQRLLEGFAFLTARIRERIDDAVPEVVDALGQLVVPQAVRPLPACSVLQFEPNAAALRSGHVVQAGAQVGTTPVKGTSCVFRTVSDVHLLPIALGDAKLNDAASHATRITVPVRNRNGLLLSDIGKLRLFLHGPMGVASTVLLWLTQHLQRVDVVVAGETHRLEGGVLPAGFLPEMSMLPWPKNAPQGLRVLQEFFTLPQKLLFADVLGFGGLPAGLTAPDFELVFTFDRPPRLPERLPSDLFRLHCVPVANLFEVDAEPILRTMGEEEYLVRAAGHHPHHIEVYSVDAVTGLTSTTGRRREYGDFYDFEHLGRSRADQAFFVVRRSGSPIDNRIDSYLAVRTPADVRQSVEDEVLSMRLTCTNRVLPNELRVGDISARTAQSPTIAKFSNITHVSRPTRSPVGQELHWRVTAHLALNTQSLCDGTALRGMLREYNGHEETDQQLFRANAKYIESIRAVRATSERRIIDRTPMRGLHVHVELDEDAFSTPAEAYVFGGALDWLFLTETPLNTFHRLTVTLHPSGTVYTWQAKLGTQEVF
ncbi:MAG: type VI secretion system baseplate subunit TssF [Myxococcales bacterium]|nr:type VI secretion system baseplate subunit TssF [Myxococcales bacterium]